MLDVIYEDGEIFVSYTEDRGDDKTSTSIARGFIENDSFSKIEIFSNRVLHGTTFTGDQD